MAEKLYLVTEWDKTFPKSSGLYAQTMAENGFYEQSQCQWVL